MGGDLTDEDVRALVAEARYKAVVRGLIDARPDRPSGGEALRVWLQEVTDQAMGMMSEDELEALAHLLRPDGPSG